MMIKTAMGNISFYVFRGTNGDRSASFNNYDYRYPHASVFFTDAKGNLRNITIPIQLAVLENAELTKAMVLARVAEEMEGSAK